MMIEADVNLGKVHNSKEVLPIMAHPPDVTSDLTLANFLSIVAKVCGFM